MLSCLVFSNSLSLAGLKLLRLWHKVWLMLGHFTIPDSFLQNVLSTSTLSTNNISIGGFCPVVLDGFGLGYQVFVLNINDSFKNFKSDFLNQNSFTNFLNPDPEEWPRGLRLLVRGPSQWPRPVQRVERYLQRHFKSPHVCLRQGSLMFFKETLTQNFLLRHFMENWALPPLLIDAFDFMKSSF